MEMSPTKPLVILFFEPLLYQRYVTESAVVNVLPSAGD